MSKAHQTAQQLFESAMLHLNSGDRANAAIQLQQALILNPEHDGALNNRGLALLGLGHPLDCTFHMDRALAIKEEPEYYNNRGAAWLELGQYEKALADYDRALALKQFEHAHNNRGNVLNWLGRPQEAREAYKAAIAFNPDYVDAHLNLSFLDLADGDFEAGWKGYEWRWRSSQLVQRGLPLPAWDGRESKTPEDGLLLYGEQGMGDALQFCRFAPPAKALWKGKVYVEVREPLRRLVSTLQGIDGVTTYGEALPPGITHCLPLMSCPRVLGTRVETIPNATPYLAADATRTAMWRERLAELPNNLGHNMLVGACWGGMSRAHQPAAAATDQRRSTSLSDWAPLARTPGVTWTSLQKGPPADQITKCPPGMTIVDWTEDLDDWYDTAALIECLDLVITVDTAVAHCAAALNKPTWILSRHDGCWRWMGKRTDSPWYPSVKLFHQPSQGDWSVPMIEATTALRPLAQRHGMRSVA